MDGLVIQLEKLQNNCGACKALYHPYCMLRICYVVDIIIGHLPLLDIFQLDFIHVYLNLIVIFRFEHTLGQHQEHAKIGYLEVLLTKLNFIAYVMLICVGYFYNLCALYKQEHL